MDIQALQDSIHYFLPKNHANQRLCAAQYDALTYHYKPISLIQELFQRELLLLYQKTQIHTQTALKLAPAHPAVFLTASITSNSLNRTLSSQELITACQYEASLAVSSRRARQQLQTDKLTQKESKIAQQLQKIDYQSQGQFLAERLEIETKVLAKLSHIKLLEIKQFLNAKTLIPERNFAEALQLLKLRWAFAVRCEGRGRLAGISAYQQNYLEYCEGLVQFRKRRLTAQIDRFLLEKEGKTDNKILYIVQQLVEKLGMEIDFGVVLNLIHVWAAAARQRYERVGRPQEVYYPLKQLIKVDSELQKDEIAHLRGKDISEISLMDELCDVFQRLNEALGLIEVLQKYFQKEK